MKVDIAPHSQSSVFWQVLILVSVLLAVFSVTLLNKAPLFYFDSLSYIDQGTSILKLVVQDDWLIQAPATLLDGTPASDANTGGNSTVNGSRSAMFSLLLAILYHTHLLALFPVIGAFFVVMALLVPLRAAMRQEDAALPLFLLLGMPLMVAAAGSLPFYLSYLMPDIFAPILLIVCATLLTYGPDLMRSELLLTATVGLIAILAHPSHLAIAAGMVPIVLVLTLLNRRDRGWIAPLVLAVLVVFGVGERLLFRSAANAIAKTEVTYFPYLTARIVADGPGMTYLADQCPDVAVPTCALFDALTKSDDPLRLTATNIVFATTPELGSFRLLEREDQRRVVQDQLNFIREVVVSNPSGFAASLVRNTLAQARLNSIEMTIPRPANIANASRLFPEAGLDRGRMIADQAWLAPVEVAHRMVYAVSFAVIVFLLAWPRRVSRQVKLFALMVLLGIFANAFVCGAISQPANRYGARVIWLLPLVATILTLFAWPQRNRLGGR